MFKTKKEQQEKRYTLTAEYDLAVNTINSAIVNRFNRNLSPLLTELKFTADEAMEMCGCDYQTIFNHAMMKIAKANPTIPVALLKTPTEDVFVKYGKARRKTMFEVGTCLFYQADTKYQRKVMPFVKIEYNSEGVLEMSFDAEVIRPYYNVTVSNKTEEKAKNLETICNSMNEFQNLTKGFVNFTDYIIRDVDGVYKPNLSRLIAGTICYGAETIPNFDFLPDPADN